MFTRRLRAVRDRRFLTLLERCRAADAAFLNLEAPIFEPAAYPVKQYLYTSYVTSEAWLPGELRWAGFNLASLANNHMSDWSPEAIARNRRELEQAGISCSGAGMTLSEARSPAYLDTGAGRVGLISVDSSFEYGTAPHVQMASDPHGSVRGRPGTNGLRFDVSYELRPDDFEAFRSVYANLRLQREGLETAHAPPFPSDERFRFRGVDVRRGEETAVRTKCRSADLEAILRWIRSTRAQVDVLVVSHHNHAARGEDWELPADFAREFAHSAIDAGADLYLGHGYTLKGVELRGNGVIFHDLGDWALQDASARRHPRDAYAHWGLDAEAPPGEFADVREANRKHVTESGDNAELLAEVAAYRHAGAGSVMAEVEFGAAGPVAIDLVPCVFSGGKRHQRDTPLAAEGAEAAAILHRVATASAAFCTEVRRVGDTGRIVLGKAPE
jgi:poly-gamma-glutamate capsule biosynthesis protein CapA/YwtB (metallophosphatase superfamily)